MKRSLSQTFIVCLFASTALAHLNGALYSTLYPQYAELCALTKIVKISPVGLPIKGGNWGHAVMYLRGACRVRNAPYPQLKLCSSTDQATGAGVSVDDMYKNVNWTAVDGRRFFFYGGLNPGQTLTPAAYLQAEKVAEQRGILNGVEVHQSKLKNAPAGMTLESAEYQNATV